ncbi:thiamine pyrophosphate-dependent enzyme [Burkholderia cepacia]|uniref:thiamine pyrophosphate-dependent enzyme n=1 Tax=Burkholderia cepacia TaxID=292 RepID=UPI001CF53AFD|nr:thiamine pyrophosphate-dependent enzyme [Burkholderia cepacia]MCA8350739.1 thiamine pyrophosphate-dependent enzyme [Burkholderia cepacia]
MEIQTASVSSGNLMHYCQGCTHKTVNNILADVIDDLGIAGRITGIAPVGCSSYLMNYLNVDILAGPHGRGPAMATAIKELTNRLVFTYQGDGDMAAIGTAEIFHAAVRANNFTVIYVNNATYGMTTGQSSPTSLLGQKTRTDKNGRDSGNPFDIAMLLSKMPGVRYVERVSCNSAENVEKTRAAIRKAFENQMAFDSGLSIVEVMAICPPSLKKSVADANVWLHDDLLDVYYPGLLSERNLGVLCDGS